LSRLLLRAVALRVLLEGPGDTCTHPLSRKRACALDPAPAGAPRTAGGPCRAGGPFPAPIPLQIHFFFKNPRSTPQFLSLVLTSSYLFQVQHQATAAKSSQHSFRVSLFYVNDIGSTGSRGRTWGFPVFTLRLNSDAGYAVLLLTLLGAVTPR